MRVTQQRQSRPSLVGGAAEPAMEAGTSGIENSVAEKPRAIQSVPPPLAVREADAAAMLGIDVAALQNDRRDAKRGLPLKFPYIKFGSRVLYRTDDLRAALDRLPRVEGVR